jgi:uncharacterized protein YkwD
MTSRAAARTAAVLAAAAVAIGTGATTSSAAGSTSPAAGAPGYAPVGTGQLLTLVNRQRRAAGLVTLTLDPRLCAIARAHTQQMAADGNLRHNDALFSPSSHASLRMKALGENVGWNYNVPAQHDAFMRSPGHRANVMAPGFRVAGFAVVRAGDGRIWTTEDFGTPS